MLDSTRILKAIDSYKKDIKNYNEEIGRTQSFIQKNQAEIKSLTEEMEVWVSEIKDLQIKAMAATEAVKVLEDIVE